MQSGRYTVVELWKDLQSDFQQFIKDENISVSSKEDERAYDISKDAIAEMIRIGLEAEQINFFLHPIQKSMLGLQAKGLFTKKFGVEKIPPINGCKSLAFVERVIIPFVSNTEKIQHEWWLVYLCKIVGMDLANETTEAKRLKELFKGVVAAKKLEMRDDQGKLLTSVGLFSVSKVNDDKTILHENRLAS